MSTSRVIPIFRIFDEKLAETFYVDWLGFAVDWKHRFSDNAPLYMQVTRNDIVLHLSGHHGDCTPGSKAFIEYGDDLKQYHQELTAKNYKYNKPGLGIAPWNALTMEVIDPFGNKLLFSQPLK